MQTKQSSKIQCLVFDYDGTICQTHLAIIKSIKASFRHFLLPEPETEELNNLITTGGHAFSSFGALQKKHPQMLQHPQQKWIEVYRNYYRIHGHQLCKIYDNIIPCLEALAPHYPMHIISNKMQNALEESLRYHKLEHYFQKIIGVHSTGPRKPDSAIFHQRLSPHVSCHPSEILMIGDTTTDLNFAQQCGMQACWVNYGYGHADDCKSHAKLWEITSPIELLEKLAQPVT